jgi:N-acetylneuraminic acid mutarotase
MKPRLRKPSSKLVLVSAAALAFVFGGDAQTPFTWATKSPNPLVRFEAVGGAAGGKLYQFSGYYTCCAKILATPECDAYDPATDKWSSLANIPQPISHSGQVVDEDNAAHPIFWLAGGFLGDHPGPSTTEVWKYDIVNNSWSSGPPLPAPRAGGVLVKFGRELHYYGGTVRVNGVYQKDYGTHWALDLDGGTAWRTTTTSGQLLAPMPNPRNHMGGTELNGKLYAIGGQYLGAQDTTNQTEVDVYDPTTNTWTQATPLPVPTGHVTANVFVRNGHIIVTAGRGQGGTKLANVLDYDPSTAAWTSLPSLPSGRQSPVSGLVGSQMVVTCGSNGSLQNQTWVSEAPQVSGQSVVSFTLINADTDQPVAGYQTISNGAVIKTASIGTTHLNIRANTNPTVVGSVRFGLDGNPNARMENSAPYALFGNSGSNYNAGSFATGQHTLTGTPYTNSSGQGAGGAALSISFTIQ